VQVHAGDVFRFETPNYMQLFGIPRSLGAEVRTFRLRPDASGNPIGTNSSALLRRARSSCTCRIQTIDGVDFVG